MKVNMHEAKTQLSKLVDRAHAGEEIVIAKAGQPYARLVGITKPVRPRVPGMLRQQLPKVEDAVWFDRDEDIETLFAGDASN